MDSRTTASGFYVKVLSPEDYPDRAVGTEDMDAALFGCILLILVHNSLIWLSLREKIPALYVAYLCAYLAFGTLYYGTAYAWLFFRSGTAYWPWYHRLLPQL